MQAGVEIYQNLGDAILTLEVFPSASYRQLAGANELAVTLNVGQLWPGPRDMLDAAVAALTVREFVLGHGCAVGGGDGLGEIVIPRQLNPQIPEVCNWPA